MDETYGTYADDECFDIQDYDDDTDHDTDDDTGDDTDDCGRGNRRPLPGGAVHFSPPVPPGGGGFVQIFGIWIPSGIPLTREWVNSPPLLAGAGL